MAIIRRNSDSFPRVPDLFDDFFRMNELMDDRMLSRVRGVAADLYETDTALVAEMAVPGLKPDEINISLSGDTLTVSGESKEEETDKKKGYYQRQLRYGSFAQSFGLPVAVDADKVDATFKNGMLKITMPKADAAKKKNIKVKTE